MSTFRKPRRPDVYWSKEGPEGPWDYIVIGSGMGGMTSAAILAELGKRVLVLEQHYVPGGFTHTFKRKGYHWDVGVHAVGEVTTHSMPGRILAKLSRGNLKWASLGEVYEEFHFPDGVDIEFPDTPAKFVANLKAAFPDEHPAIDEYMALVREVSQGMRPYWLARAMPKGVSSLADRFLAKGAQEHFLKRTKDVIESLTDNPQLRTVFTAQWGYYGAPPSRASFAMQALVLKHFLYGAYYPEGGSKAIAQWLLKRVADEGGWTRVGADVDEIIIKRGKAIGVRLQGGEEIFAKKIISAAGVMSTIQRMMPEGAMPKEAQRSIGALRPASAHVCLYIGFKGDIRRIGASGANKWFWNTWDCEHEVWDVKPEGPMPKAPLLYCSFPSLKDPLHDPGEEVRHTGEVVTFVPWEVFEPWKNTDWKKRGADYDAFKKRMEDALLKQYLEKLPEIEPMIDFVELSTPLSTQHFARPMKGSIYGLEPTPERFANPWLRCHSPVKNLYFGGSEVATVGVIGAMMGGVLAAVAAEPLKGVAFMKNA